jgi:FixJ family two-component response regulator
MTISEAVIAIIDDDPDIREAMQRVLASRGYQTELYASAEQFIVGAAASRAACLLLDVDLGHLTGIELARHLSASGFTFPIVFMTGSSNEVARRRAMELGCVAYLDKPFTSDQLLAALTKAINQGQ